VGVLESVNPRREKWDVGMGHFGKGTIGMRIQIATIGISVAFCVWDLSVL
jgi:hypothetical protein